MKIIDAANVNDAYVKGWKYLLEDGVGEATRNGQAIVSPVPVTTMYSCPTERVLFSTKRRANPFFHLAESIWMLCGRNDAEFLNLFIKDFGDRFAESDGKIHGAYGYRWREHFDIDQLFWIIDILQKEPTSRQAVLAMWDPFADLGAVVKDKPCNTHVYFRKVGDELDMTVCCRSNDIVWGAYGANAVHFSVLQEFLVDALGCFSGTYYQISNNYHVYNSVLEKHDPILRDLYEQGLVRTTPLSVGDAPKTWLAMAAKVLEGDYEATHHPFLSGTLTPMISSYRAYRDGNKERAIEYARVIAGDDWRLACLEWLDPTLISTPAPKSD